MMAPDEGDGLDQPWLDERPRPVGHPPTDEADTVDLASSQRDEREVMTREFLRLGIPLLEPGGDGDAPRADGTAGPLASGSDPVPYYRLVERIGRGGSAEVWKATGPGGVPLALKLIRVGEEVGGLESRSEASIRRLRRGSLRSLELMREVRHPNLLPFFAAWLRDSTLIVAMELAEGTLLDRCGEAIDRGLPGIPFPELIESMRQAARGIDFLNEPRHALLGREKVGIQHRDVKPQNLLLVGGAVKVGDFGLAKLLEDSSGHTNAMTPAYAAPEFFQGRLCRQSDQYSFAITYCRLRGGRLPFVGTQWEVMMGHTQWSPDLSMLPGPERPAIARALAKEPEARWPDCGALVDALLAAHVPDHDWRPEPEPAEVDWSHPIPAPSIPDPGPKRRRRFLAVGSLATAALLVGLGAWVVALQSDREIGSNPGGRPDVVARTNPVEGLATPEPEPPVSRTGSPPEVEPGPRIADASPAGPESTSEVSSIEAEAIGPPAEGPSAPRFDDLLAALDRLPDRWRYAIPSHFAPIPVPDPNPEPTNQADERVNRAADERAAGSDDGPATHRAETGAVVEAPAPIPLPRAATIRVAMPTTDANLVVKGEVGRGNPDEWYGPERVIHTTLLDEEADYVIGAYWIDAQHRPTQRNCALKVEPGGVYRVDLRPPTPTTVRIGLRPPPRTHLEEPNP